MILVVACNHKSPYQKVVDLESESCGTEAKVGGFRLLVVKME